MRRGTHSPRSMVSPNKQRFSGAPDVSQGDGAGEPVGDEPRDDLSVGVRKVRVGAPGDEHQGVIGEVRSSASYTPSSAGSCRACW